MIKDFLKNLAAVAAGFLVGVLIAGVLLGSAVLGSMIAGAAGVIAGPMIIFVLAYAALVTWTHREFDD